MSSARDVRNEYKINLYRDCYLAFKKKENNPNDIYSKSILNRHAGNAM